MKHTQNSSPRLLVLGTAMALLIIPSVAQAQYSAGDAGVIIQEANENEVGDGTMGPAAAAAMRHGALPTSAADIARKAAANRAHQKARRSLSQRPATPSELDATGGTPGAPLAPAVVGGLNFAGQSGSTSSPPDTTGAIGLFRYIQLVNSQGRIYNRNTGAVVATGTLQQLASVAPGVNAFDPQMIWDEQTNRFYYVMDTVFSAIDNRLSWGFSKTATPQNFTTSWCHYNVGYGMPFPDYPKLGDSKHFVIIGVNVFNPGFVGSDIVAISKPPAGTTCPAATTFKRRINRDLRDSAGAQVVTPVPSLQTDLDNVGYVVTRNGVLPSTNLWFFNVSKKPGGNPLFGTARGVTVPSYDTPASADQPTFMQVLDTLDARMTQAVQAFNPIPRTRTFYVQHTIAPLAGTGSDVRWYEIDPVPANPVLQRTERIHTDDVFTFNGAISPDRAVNGASRRWGKSFVVQYNESSATAGISPRIVASSSVNGGALSSSLVTAGVGPYRDFTCPNPGDECRWGDYAGAAPDPRTTPSVTGRGVVWGTNQFSGVASPPAGGVNWVTRIFKMQP